MRDQFSASAREADSADGGPHLPFPSLGDLIMDARYEAAFFAWMAKLTKATPDSRTRMSEPHSCGRPPAVAASPVDATGVTGSGSRRMSGPCCAAAAPAACAAAAGATTGATGRG